MMRNAGTVLVGSLLLVIAGGPEGNLWAAEGTPGPSASVDKQDDRPPDLTLELPITAGDDERTQFVATVPGFALVGARLDPDSDKTRLMVGVRFTSQSVRRVRLEMWLMREYGDSQSVQHLAHIETLGPEQVRTEGRNLDAVRDWDDPRALWFDLPREARGAKALRIEAHLERTTDRGDDGNAERER